MLFYAIYILTNATFENSSAQDTEPENTLHLHGQIGFPQNDIGHVVKEFITQISNPPTKIMVIGPMFTPEAKVIAETSALYNLVEVRIQRTTLGWESMSTMLCF